MVQMTFYEVAAGAVNAVADALTPRPEYICVVPGEIAWDTCDCEGMLVATWERFYLSESFPTENVSEYIGSDCAPPYRVGMLRIALLGCVPGLHEDGSPPSCAELDASAQQIYNDAPIVSSTLACYLRDLVEGPAEPFRIQAYHMRDTIIVGPMGNCVGSETRALVGLMRCTDGDC